MPPVQNKPYVPKPTWFFEKITGDIFCCEERQAFNNIYRVQNMNRHLFKLIGYSDMAELHRKMKDWSEANKGKRFGPKEGVEKGATGNDEYFALINNPNKADVYNQAFREETEIAKENMKKGNCPMPREEKVLFSDSMGRMSEEMKQRIRNFIG